MNDLVEFVPLPTLVELRMGETIIASDCSGDGIPIFSADKGAEPWNYSTKVKVRNKRGALVIGARGTIGYPRLPDYDEFGATQTTIVVTPKGKEVDPTFLYYSLSMCDFNRITAQQAVPMLTISDLGKVFVPRVSARRRDKIVFILAAVDRAIESTEALIEKYQQIKAGLMHDLFTRGIGADGKLRPPREQAPDLYQQTPIGWIPKSWSCVLIDSVIESIVDGPFGSNLKSEHYVIDPGVRVVRLQNIQTASYNDEDRAFVSDRYAMGLLRNKVVGGDILIAGLGEDRYPVGRTCLYPAELPPAINKADCFRVRCNDAMNAGFLMYFLNTTAARKQVKRFEQGVTRPRINLGNLKKLRVALPEVGEQGLIVHSLENLARLIERERETRNKLVLQKAGLMHDLLAGQRAVQVTAESTEVDAHV